MSNSGWIGLELTKQREGLREALERLVAAVTPIVDVDQDDPDVGYVAREPTERERRAVEQELDDAHMHAIDLLDLLERGRGRAA
jgi:hypothetical protein